MIVVGSYDNFVHCVDAQKGKVIWKFETQITSMASLRFTRATVVFGGCDSVLYVVNLKRKIDRSVEVEAPIAASYPSGMCRIGNMDRAVMAFDLETGEAVGITATSSLFFSCPYRNVLIGRDEACIASANLRKIEWRFAAHEE